LELENENLKNRLDIQKEVVNAFQQQILNHLPELYAALKTSVEKKKDN